MDQLAAGPGFPGDHYRVSAAPDAGKLANPYINRLALRQTPDPGVTNRVHGFLRSGGTEPLIADTRDENIETLAPRRE
jgi:hypothetical protein